MPRDLQKGDDSRRNWKTINENSARLRALETQARALNAAVAELRRGLGGERLEAFPFRVHTIPNSRRAADDADWWRKFFVRHGYCGPGSTGLVATANCEDTDGEGTTAEEITVPDATAVYYVWVEMTVSGGVVTAASMEHGASPWGSYPDLGSGDGTQYRLLAKIDTDTYSAEKRAVVRQFQDEDIWLGGGGSSNVVLKRAKVITEYSDCLLCHEVDENDDVIADPPDLWVAKPHDIRMTTWNNVTYLGVDYTFSGFNRIATIPASGGQPERSWSQQLNQTYENAILHIAKGWDRGLNVAIGEGEGQCEWLDITGCRHWQDPYQFLVYCINEELYWAVVRGLTNVPGPT